MNCLLTRDRRWWLRATLGALLMIGVNFAPLWLTWGDWQTDGVETVGWPIAFWEFGGIGGSTMISPGAFLLDGIIALLAARFAADVTSGNVASTIHRLRTWPRRD